MARLSSLFFRLLAALLVTAATPPSTLASQNLLGEIIDTLGIGIVTAIDATITITVRNVASLSKLWRTASSSAILAKLAFKDHIRSSKSLIFEVTLDRVVSTAGINDTEYASFDHTFAKGLVVPPLGKAIVPNVTLTQGANRTQVSSTALSTHVSPSSSVRALMINGALGVPLTISGLHKKNVTTTYTLALS
ncbi:hypothetical protein C8R46DRAFT_1225836 [Mycena filopes]|nr:hypothetical protein C8R46DRAFT_1225836 [Mycena filopes]